MGEFQCFACVQKFRMFRSTSLKHGRVLIARRGPRKSLLFGVLCNVVDKKMLLMLLVKIISCFGVIVVSVARRGS